MLLQAFDGGLSILRTREGAGAIADRERLSQLEREEVAAIGRPQIKRVSSLVEVEVRGVSHERWKRSSGNEALAGNADHRSKGLAVAGVVPKAVIIRAGGLNRKGVAEVG